MSREFLNFETLKEDVVYTVKTVQRLRDEGYYNYLITVADAQDELVKYMTIYGVETSLSVIYDKLEADRMKGLTMEFTFTKTMIESEQSYHTPYIVVAGENEVVELRAVP